MKEIKYRTSKKWAGSIAVLLGSGFLLAFFLSGRNFYNSTVIGLALACLLLILNAFSGIYLSVGNKSACKVDCFVIKKCINIEHIKRISRQPTFNLDKSFGDVYKSLYIISDSDGKMKYLELPNESFTEETGAKIVKHLKELNPNIELDEQTLILIKKYENPDKIKL
ncbi:hypothetical protein EPN83_02195 [Patescibacteria group bacterium]|nr:MAG: hypothetical protein EPN83_02195 [Patescibacteria group bacterium]